MRTLEFVVSDGDSSRSATPQARNQHDPSWSTPRSLTYRQVNEEPRRYRITKTYVTDPARNVLLVDVRFESLTGKKLDARRALRPRRSGTTTRTTSRSRTGPHCLATDSGSPVASAVVGSPAFERTSSAGERRRPRPDRRRRRSPACPGARRSRWRSASARRQRGARRRERLARARASPRRGPPTQAGWHGYLGGLKRHARERRRQALQRLRDDARRARGQDLPRRLHRLAVDAVDLGQLEDREPVRRLPPRLVARPVPDRHRADRGGRHGRRQPRAGLPVRPAAEGRTARSRRTPTVDGKEHWTNLQLDEVALPIVLAWQLGRTDGALYRDHIKKAADFIVNFPNAPFTPQERWENQSGYSPGTIASEIAGLVCAADIARRNGDTASADRYLRTADDWQKRVQGWTATTNGPYSPRPYYLRLTKDGKPNSGTAYNIGDSGPTVDQRKVVDPSFLELVRLGVKPASDPAIRNTVAVVDQQLASGEPSGRYFWHRFNFDGYGEQKDGSPWDFGFPQNPTENWANNTTIGRNWPIFGGERGEYELLDRQLGGGSRSPRPHGRGGERRPDAARAGVGARLPAGRPARLPARRGHLLGDAAGVVTRSVRPARVVDRRGPPRGAAHHRRRAIRRLRLLALALVLAVALDGDDLVVLVEPDVDGLAVGARDLDLPGGAVLRVALDGVGGAGMVRERGLARPVGARPAHLLLARPRSRPPRRRRRRRRRSGRARPLLLRCACA